MFIIQQLENLLLYLSSCSDFCIACPYLSPVKAGEGCAKLLQIYSYMNQRYMRIQKAAAAWALQMPSCSFVLVF